MHPSLYLPLARLKRLGSVLDPTRTELVLDGLERSANTFAAVAFQLAQNGTSVAHHMHAVAPLIEAAARGVPAMITVRAPEPRSSQPMIRQPAGDRPTMAEDICGVLRTPPRLPEPFVIAPSTGHIDSVG